MVGTGTPLRTLAGAGLLLEPRCGDTSGTANEERVVGHNGETVKRFGIKAARTLCTASAPLSLDALRRLGALAGEVALRRNSRAARTTRTNIDIAFPAESAAWRRRLVRASVRQTAMTAFEAAALWTWPLPRLLALLRDVRGEEALRTRAAGRGALLLAPHFGNWEFLGYYLNTVEPLTPLYERPRSPAVNAALVAARARLGSRPAADSVAGLRQLVTGLQRGGLVAIMPDQVPRTGVRAPFFGQTTQTMALVSKLLRRSAADVFVSVAARAPGGFAVRIETVDAAIADPDPVKSATVMNAAVEAVVRRDPAQYQWEYKRFRFPGEPNVYR